MRWRYIGGLVPSRFCKKAPIIRDQGLFIKIEAVAGFRHRDRLRSFKIDRQLNRKSWFRVLHTTPSVSSCDPGHPSPQLPEANLRVRAGSNSSSLIQISS